MAEPLPPRLMAEVARTLRPVAPLPSPVRRVLVLLPLAGLLLAAVQIGRAHV